MSVKSYPNKRDCEHGQLRRSCPVCAADAEYAALRARHNALRDAVAWERETYMFWEFGRTYTLMANDEALESMFAARSEVDRLIASQGSADCKGEE